MRIFAVFLLTLGAIWSAGWCAFVSLFGKSAIHEILAAVYLLTFAVCIAGLGLIAAVDRAADRLPRPRPRTE